ncbi:MAG: BamA/TamA family outer membrane protein [Nitrospirota bacterium]
MDLLRLCAAVLIFAGLAIQPAAAEDSFPPERRKPQFMNDKGYYIFPMPYSIPGVGEGVGVMGIGMNLGATYTDVFAFALAGSLPGEGLGVSDIHIIPRTLILDVTTIQFGKSTITSYQQRGMQSSEHDFSYLQFDHYGFTGGRLTSTFLDRRFEVYGGGYRIGSQLEKVLKPNGDTILDIQNPPTWRTNVYGFGVRGDLTDDYYDPRRGVRLDIGRWWSPPASNSDPKFYRMEYNASAYLPLGKRSTWVFNYFRSDAHVQRQGETNLTTIENDQGLNCSSLTGEDQIKCNQIVQNIRDANTYGTATSLGGTSRLRSYPDGRFSGAHTVFYGTEVRWTLTEEAHPFDIFIAKDVRTVMQVALFYEMGSAADLRDELGDIFRSSYGAGFRMVTASGLVLRADVATGREGIETTILIGYPWESF